MEKLKEEKKEYRKPEIVKHEKLTSIVAIDSLPD